MENTTKTAHGTAVGAQARSLRTLFNAEAVIFIVFILFKLLYFNYQMAGIGNMSVAMVAACLGSILILIWWTAMLPPIGRAIVMLAVDIAVTFVAFSDTLFFRYFSDVISMPVLTQASNVGAVQSSVLDLLHRSDIFLVIDFLLSIPVFYYLFKGRKERIKRPFVHNFVRALIILVLGVCCSWFGVSTLLKSQPNIFLSFYDRTFIVQNIGLLNFHGIDAYKFVKQKLDGPAKISDTEKQKLEQFLLEKKKAEPENKKLFGVGKGKNLIVIQVEALQQFVINAKINGQEITPNLNKLAGRSVYFNNYFCETAGGGTSDAEFLANVSLFPVKDGAVYIRYSGNEYYSMAKKLKEEGYNSIVMHAYKPGFWNRSVMYNTLGFDEFFKQNDLKQDEIIGMGLSDKSFLRQSLDKLKTMKEPYYAFLITLTSHYPYNNDKSLYSKFDVGEYKDTFFGNYLEAIHYADEALGQFIDGLEKEGMLDDSVLALYGDHFAIPKDKRDALAKYLNIKDMNSFNWVMTQKVPMLIHIPGERYKGTRTITGGGIDFMPTIMNIMGVDTQNMPMLGRDLSNSINGLAIMRNGYFKDNKYLCLTADGVAFYAKDGKPYPIEKMEEEKLLMQQSLDASDKIIENNLVKELREFLEKNPVR